MMPSTQKQSIVHRTDLFFLILLTLFFFLTRLAYINSFPLYIDEATHIYIAKLTVDGQFWVGLSETAKQIYIWLVAICLHLFHDPIFAGRFVSVLGGFGSLLICYALARQLYPRSSLIVYLSAFFYLISPFALMFDRMALADGLLVTLMGLTLLLSVKLWQKGTYRWAILLGLAFGLAVLNKAYAIFYYPTPILLWSIWGRRIKWNKIYRLLSVTYTLASLSWLLIFIVGRSAYEFYLNDKSFINTSSPAAAGLDFLGRLGRNIALMGDWLGSYLTLPLIMLLLFTLIRIFIRRDKAGYLLIIWVMIPLWTFAVAFTDLYSRYLVPIIVPLTVLMAWGMEDLVHLLHHALEKRAIRIGRNTLQNGLILGISLPALVFSYKIIFDPYQAPFPLDDRKNYVVHAQLPQGYEKAAQTIELLTQKYGKVILLRHGLPTPLELIFKVYLPNQIAEQMEIIDISSFDQITPEALNRLAMEAPVFTVEGDLIRQNSTDPDTYIQLWPVFSFSEGIADATLYQWLLPSDFAYQWVGGDESTFLLDSSVPYPLVTDISIIEESQTQLLTKVQASIGTDIDYILLTPGLVQKFSAPFAPFVAVEEQKLIFQQFPSDWWLTFTYPDLNCQWCLFQLSPPTHSHQALFNEMIRLEGYDLLIDPTSLKVKVTLYWHSLASPSASYKVFIHLLDPADHLVSQVDTIPLRGKWPTSQWHKDYKFADQYHLPLDSEGKSGVYSVWIGLYEPIPITRLPVQAESDILIRDNAVLLTPLLLEFK